MLPRINTVFPIFIFLSNLFPVLVRLFELVLLLFLFLFLFLCPFTLPLRLSTMSQSQHISCEETEFNAIFLFKGNISVPVKILKIEAFLGASSHLYKRVSSFVHRSVGPSVRRLVVNVKISRIRTSKFWTKRN